MNWDSRDDSKNKQDALAALADLLSSADTIQCDSEAVLVEAEEFAKKWNVPFSKELYDSMISKIDDKRWDDDSHPYFQSSNSNC